MSRLPGAKREIGAQNGGEQRLIYLNPEPLGRPILGGSNGHWRRLKSLSDKWAQPNGETEPEVLRPAYPANGRRNPGHEVQRCRLTSFATAIWRKESLTFLGAGGIGKSRLVMQLAVCSILGRDFIGMETVGCDHGWLFLQSENSNRRLSRDLAFQAMGWRHLAEGWRKPHHAHVEMTSTFLLT